MNDVTDLVWSERYRPKTIEECILPQNIKDIAKGFVENKNIPTLLFTGSAGVGKTTLAHAIANELEADFMKINASTEGSIDTIRTKLTQFASTVSFSNSKKITLLDEIDGSSIQAQQGLRGFIEEFAHNHSIIFTCNFSGKVIDALKSRSKVIDFKVSSKDKTEMASQFMKRCINILNENNVEFDKKVLAELVMKKFPDFRSVLNELQGYAAGGKIDEGILLDLTEDAFNQLIGFLKNKKFTDVRKWVAEHSDVEPIQLFRTFYDKSASKLENKSIPELILLLGEFSYKSSLCADQEINTMAFLTNILLNQSIVWK